MEECPKYRLHEKSILLKEKEASALVSLSFCFAESETPLDPPPYSQKPVILQRSGSQYKRRSQLICPATKKAKLKGACPICVARYLRDVLRAWVLSQRKPYTAITVQIDQLTSEQYEPDDFSGIPDLVEVIRIQDSGPTEAARAIRKKLCVLCYLHDIISLTWS